MFMKLTIKVVAFFLGHPVWGTLQGEAKEQKIIPQYEAQISWINFH